MAGVSFDVCYTYLCESDAFVSPNFSPTDSVNATVFIIIPKGLFSTTLHYMLIYLLRITSSVSVSATTIIMIF